ncbi:hypothetical protein J6590_051016 [Homalodisca vitripennis]|nr:hypothetical protein J6590_051016 [Homalodisca vitripennis]
MVGLKKDDSFEMHSGGWVHVLTETGLYLLEVICYSRFHCEIATEEQIHEHFTRHKTQLRSPSSRLAVGFVIPQFAGVMLFNKISADIMVVGCEVFKMKLR